MIAVLAMPLLELKQLRKDYGGLRALDDVTLDVPEGAIIGLIGPNGSGKSTLIDLVAGSIAPTAGQIIFAGDQIGGLGADEVFQRGIARGYQQPTLYFKMTALDNLLLPPKSQLGERPMYAPWHRRWADQEAENAERALHALQQVELLPHYDKLAADLSGGQMKLLEIARALMGEPRLLLLDEPTAGVAPLLARDIFQRIARLRDQQGITFLIVEHRLEILFDFVDEVYALHLGELIAQGAPVDVAGDRLLQQVYFGD